MRLLFNGRNFGPWRPVISMWAVRLKPGVTRQRAQEEVRAMWQSYHRERSRRAHRAAGTRLAGARHLHPASEIQRSAAPADRRGRAAAIAGLREPRRAAGGTRRATHERDRHPAGHRRDTCTAGAPDAGRKRAAHAARRGWRDRARVLQRALAGPCPATGPRSRHHAPDHGHRFRTESQRVVLFGNRLRVHSATVRDCAGLVRRACQSR